MLLKRTFTTLLFILLVLPLQADAPRVFAITGGTVHPVSGPDIANGVVVIRDGLIESVGNVAAPAEATIIDAKGLHVYPGLIDAQTSLGFAAPPRRNAPSAPGARREEPPPETSAAFRAAENAKISDDDAESKRATGVTTIVTAPSFGIFNGQSVALNLGDGPTESRIIRQPVAQQVSFNPRSGFSNWPGSLMGVIADIRQTLLDAQQHSAARAIYERDPQGLQRPADSAALDALGAVLRRELPIVFIADSEAMMRRVQGLAKEFDVRYIISGARQGYRMADDLKQAGAPVLVSVKWSQPPANKDDRGEQPLRAIRDRQLAPTTPATLAKAGVNFALVSAPGKAGDFLPGIRKAIENGLTPSDALRAVTLAPARILGIDRQLGSLDRGKIANVVLTDKPLFEKESKVSRLFIDGREVRLPSEEAREKEEAAGPLDGGWSLTVRLPKGDATIQMTLKVEDGRVTGSYSGDQGSGEVRNGTFDGTTIEITISAKVEAEANDWIFRGTVREGTMEGTVTTTVGTFPFTGSKSK